MQSGPLIEHERHGPLICGLIIAALLCAAPAQAAITSLGDVAPHPATTTAASSLIVGNTVTGTVVVTAGSDVVALNSTLGQAPGALGVVQVSGSGSTWSMGQGLVVGNGGDGIVQVNSGGQVQTAGSSLGVQSGSTGIVSINGASSKWTIASNLIVGNAGTSSLAITDGGLVDLEGDLTLGNSSSGDGNIDLAGGTLRLHGGALAVGSGAASFGFGGGRLEGAGLVALAEPLVQHDGTLAPGNGVGTTTIAGGYVLDSGQLEIEINGLGAPGTQWDRLQVNGVVDLLGDNGLADAVLHVLLGFAPAIGSEFLILENDAVDSVVGTFASNNMASTTFGDQRYVFDILYGGGDGNDVVLRTESIQILGDFNGNGVVDAADYTTWRDGLGTFYTPADYDEWKSHFGESMGDSALVDSRGTVPEPATLCSAAATLIVLAIASRPRRCGTSCLKCAMSGLESSHAHES